MKKVLTTIVLIVLAYVLYQNATVTTDFRQGEFVPISNSEQLVLDTPLMAIAYLNFGEISPLNPIFYFGGYPEAGSFVNQFSLWFSWKPTGNILCLWFIYQ